MRKAVRVLSFLAGFILVGATVPVWAVDGIVLIDQNKALAGGVTPGDAPGFPVVITRPGSYRLASNLMVPNANTNAIEIADTPAVTIDLNGFSIIGPTVCSGFPLTCTPLGAGSGVITTGSSGSIGAAVRNGTVMGMGSYGVYLLGAGSTVEDVAVLSNGSGGILIELGTALRNKVWKNGGNGIFGGNSVISQNTIAQNRFVGISVNDSIVTNNALIVNGSLGLFASNTGFSGNVFSSNNGSFANPQYSGFRAIGPNLCDGSLC